MITTRWGRARTWAVAGTGAATGLVLAISAGPAGAVAPRTIQRSVSATYSCTATIFGSPHSFTSPISMSGKTPTTVKPGVKVSMTGFQSKVTIPKSLVQTAESDGVTSISASAFTWDLKATDAKVATVNAGPGISLASTPLPNPAANLVVTLPKAAKTVSGWVAVKAGTMTITDSTLKFTLNDNFNVAVPVSCTPHPAVTLAKTTVS